MLSLPLPGSLNVNLCSDEVVKVVTSTTSTKVNVTKKATQYMKAIVKSLGELSGALAAGSFIESLDLDEVWAGSVDRSRELTAIPGS